MKAIEIAKFKETVMKVRSSVIAAILGVSISGVASANELQDMSSLVGEFTTANAGKEVVVIYSQTVDTDFDNAPDSISTRFDVYPLGGANLIYSSTPKILNLQFPYWLPHYCVQDDIDDGRQAGGMALRSGPRVVNVGGFSLRCSYGNERYEHHRTFVYGASVNVAQGASWRYQVNGELMAATGLDTNNDGRYDRVAIRYLTKLDATSSNVNMVILNFATGGVVSNISYRAIN